MINTKHIIALAIVGFASADFAPPATSYGVPLNSVEKLPPVSPHFIYSVPQQVYNIPTVELPVDITPQKPIEQYGVPSTKYGAPLESVEAPIRSSFSFQIPETVILQKPVREYGVPIETPYPAQKPQIETVYGGPVETPAPFFTTTTTTTTPTPVYGVPAEIPVKFVSPPKPIQDYGVPYPPATTTTTTTPQPIYGAPIKTSVKFVVPAPVPVYGVPVVPQRPAEVYGAPAAPGFYF